MSREWTAERRENARRRKDACFRGLYDRYLAGESAYGIATELGIDTANLTKAWRRRGLLTRPASEAATLRAARMTAPERLVLVAPAHAARRGQQSSFASLCQAAATREREALHVSGLDRKIGDLLREYPGWTVGKAIGPYNVDLAFEHSAVEIFGGGWHGGGRAAARWPKRMRYILDQGWSVLVLWVEKDRQPLDAGAAEYAVAFFDAARRDPALVGQYRVIRGNGEEIIRGCSQDDHFPVKPPRGRGKRVWCEHQLSAG